VSAECDGCGIAAVGGAGGCFGRPEIESACISTGKALTGDRSCGGYIGYCDATREGILAERLQVLVLSSLKKIFLLVHHVMQQGCNMLQKCRCTIMNEIIALQQELDRHQFWFIIVCHDGCALFRICKGLERYNKK
jgi:hypothetical protein